MFLKVVQDGDSIKRTASNAIEDDTEASSRDVFIAAGALFVICVSCACIFHSYVFAIYIYIFSLVVQWVPIYSVWSNRHTLPLSIHRWWGRTYIH